MRRRSLIWLAAFAAVIILVVLVRPQLVYPLMPSGHAVPVAHRQDHVVIEGTYPEFGRAAVDAHIKALIDEDVIATAVAGIAGHPHEPGITDTLTVSYEVPYRTFRYRGVVLRIAVNSHEFQGEYVIVRTYDLWNDRIVGLTEIASPDRNPAEAALQAITARLRSREDVSPILLSRLEPRRDMLENLLVRSDGLEFYFNPGLIAPPERGVMTVVVPWDDVPDLLKP